MKWSALKERDWRAPFRLEICIDDVETPIDEKSSHR